MKNIAMSFVTTDEASKAFIRLGEAFNKIPEINWNPKSKIQKIIEFFDIKENWEIITLLGVFIGIPAAILQTLL